LKILSQIRFLQKNNYRHTASLHDQKEKATRHQVAIIIKIKKRPKFLYQ
jgi:hypothetical protein